MNISFSNYFRIGSLILLCFPFLSLQAQEAYNNPSITQEHAEAPHAYFKIASSATSALNGEEDRVLSLNGLWDFTMIEGKENIPKDFYKSDFDKTGWSQLPVPSNWQRHGFGFPVYSNMTVDTEPDEVGLYRHNFKVSDYWKNGRIILHFGGVKTAFHLYINGKKVGYQEGANLPSEFDITDYLQQGENLLAVAVYRVADIQKIENFDTWRLSGIFRDVSLQFRPSIYIEDVQVNAPMVNQYKDGQWKTKIKIKNKSTQKASKLKAVIQLVDAENQSIILEKKAKIGTLVNGETKEIIVEELLENAKAWTAETPNLYKTIVQLQQHKETLEVIAVNTGFRTIEIIDEQIKVNGQKIFFKGVNRHDWHPEMARAISKEVIKKDFEHFKKYNINAIRTSHYPNSSYVYELADEMGIYVMDEVAMETHWATHPEREEGWGPAHLDRTKRLIARDRNHPSIILWSMGNEFFNGPHTLAMYDWVEKEDPSRFIYYDGREEGTLVEKHGAVKTAAYNNFETIIESSKKHRKPVVMKEYMHAAGNEMGLFHQMWEIIRNPAYKNLHGGFIWDWKDQGWTLKDEKGTTYYDWGENAGLAATGNDGFDGITDIDLNETPKLLEVAKVFQDIVVTAIEAKEGRFEILNRHQFLPLNLFRANWKLKIDGIEKANGAIDNLAALAGETMAINLPIKTKLQGVTGEEDVQILFKFSYKNTPKYLPKNHVIAWEQIAIQKGLPIVKTINKQNPIELIKGDKSLTIRTKSAVYRYNHHLGRLISWKIDGKEIIDKTYGPKPNLWRATTDGDNSSWGGNQAKYYWPWRKIGLDNPEFLDYRVTEFKLVEEKKDRVIFDVKTKMAAAGSDIVSMNFRYTIKADGSLIIGTNFLPSEQLKKIAGLPRIGLSTHLKKEFQKVAWYGEGPHENYRDRNTSSYVDRHESSVADLYMPYVPAQANGNRSETRWMLITNGNIGFKVSRLSSLNIKNGLENLLPEGKILNEQSKNFFEFTAIPYTEHELDIVTHTKDLPISDKVVLTIDDEHAGVASHPRPNRQPEHEVKPENKSFIFMFSPVIGNN
jgi:beta-galactosidase